MITPALQKNDRRAAWLIISFSVVVFVVVAALGQLPHLQLHLGFNVHVFAQFNAAVNSIVSVLLVTALILVKNKKFAQHRNVMYVAMVLSILFLVSYIAHHLLAPETRFGDLNHDGVLSAQELAQAGHLRLFYFILLSTHIMLAAIILPFILYTAYRAMSGEYLKHKKLARYTWPLWLYVSVTGVIVYLMISPYYA